MYHFAVSANSSPLERFISDEISSLRAAYGLNGPIYFQWIRCNFFATAFFGSTVSVSVCTPSIRSAKHSWTIWIFNANFIALYIFLLNEMGGEMFFGAWINLFTSLRRSFWTLFNIEFKIQFTLRKPIRMTIFIDSSYSIYLLMVSVGRSNINIYKNINIIWRHLFA